MGGKKSSSKGKHKKSRKGKKPLAAQPLPPPSITAASPASSPPSPSASSFIAVSTQLLRASAPSSSAAAGTESITSLQQTMSTVAVAAQQHSTESRTHSLSLAEQQSAGSVGTLSVESGHSSVVVVAVVTPWQIAKQTQVHHRLEVMDSSNNSSSLSTPLNNNSRINLLLQAAVRHPVADSKGLKIDCNFAAAKNLPNDLETSGIGFGL
uniref:Uncharacterized protein n=1 Tax=Anopheles culicifacies TaxID=139723 RepID=A0A182MF82_9DIPT